MPTDTLTFADFDNLRLIQTEEGLHKLYADRVAAEGDTSLIENAHRTLTAEMRKRSLIYKALSATAAPVIAVSGKGGKPTTPGNDKNKVKPDVEGDKDAAPKGSKEIDVEITVNGQVVEPKAKKAPVFKADDTWDIFRKKDYSVEERRKFAENGLAMPDGAFPIASEADLHHAVRLVSQASDPQSAMQHIIERAKTMEMEHCLPGEWCPPEEPGEPNPGAHSMGADGKPKKPAVKKGLVNRIGEALAKAMGAEFDEDAFNQVLDANLDPEFEYAVVKSVGEDQFTLGPVYMPDTYDAHGEWATAEDLQKSTWDYVRETGADRTVYLQHSDQPAGEWVEIMSLPFSVTANMVKNIDGVRKSVATTFPAGTVMMGVVWDDWAWDDVKKGKIAGFSMGGYARRVEAEF